MTQFRYKAIDPEGQAVEGVVEGNSTHQVTLKLQERGLTVNQVVAVKDEALLNTRPSHLPWKELLLVAQQLEIIARNEYPLAPSLRAMGTALGSKRLQRTLSDVSADLEQGRDLNEALERQSNHFPPLFIHLVRAGEAANNLAEVARLLMDYCARRADSTARIRTALIYPSILFVALLVLVGILGFIVAPGITEFAGEFGMESDFISFMGLLEFLVDGELGPIGLYGPVLIGVLCYLVVVQLRRYPSGRMWLDWLKMRVPLHGPILYTASLATFTRALALLLKARAPIVESLEIAAACAGSPQLEQAVGAISLEVAEGNTLADSCENTRFFTRDYCWLLEVSENRGDLESTLGYMAESLERDLNARDMTFAALLSPVLISVIGALVLFLFIAVYGSISSAADMFG